MKLGAQLFTVKNFTQTEEDLARSLDKIAAIGYKSVQISAVGKGIKAEYIKTLCDSLDLEIVLTHNDFNRILMDTKRLIEEHDIMGCKYIGIGAMPEKYRELGWFSYFIEDMRKPLEMMEESGKYCMYHNHDFEFEKLEGVRLFDLLLEGFSEKQMGITLDTYWVQAAGADVIQWIHKLKDRIPCVHLKDMGVKGRTPIMAPVLEGNMNFVGILEALKETNAKYLLVEQDICQGNPFVCLKQSFENIKGLISI